MSHSRVLVWEICAKRSHEHLSLRVKTRKMENKKNSEKLNDFAFIYSLSWSILTGKLFTFAVSIDYNFLVDIFQPRSMPACDFAYGSFLSNLECPENFIFDSSNSLLCDLFDWNNFKFWFSWHQPTDVFVQHVISFRIVSWNFLASTDEKIFRFIFSLEINRFYHWNIYKQKPSHCWTSSNR